ncbi:MAG: aquaporin [Bacilli bacterium]|nr:aquaporin [Bacilli bacterium]
MKKYIAEFVGTFVLVLVGCGVAVLTNGSIVATSLAFGLVIVAMAYSIGNVSGCHINPAVSLGFLLTKKMEIKEFICYVISQVLGALAGSAVLGVILDSFKSLGANGFGGVGQMATNVWIALLVEIILTFIFILAILGVTSKKEYSNVAGIVIGLTLVLVHIIGIYFTGTSVNPARSLAPALLQGGEALEQVWVFIVAPFIGSALASLFHNYVLND